MGQIGGVGRRFVLPWCRRLVGRMGQRIAWLAMASVSLCGASQAAVRSEVVAQGLSFPWAVAFLPDGRFLVTERPGRLRLVQADGRIEAPIGGLPEVAVGGQGGLLDLVLDRAFERNRQLYFCFSEPGVGRESGRNGTAVAAARLSDDARRLEQVRVIFRQHPKVASQLHFGCRIAEGPRDGLLYIGLGERYSASAAAQQLDNHLGKVVRVRKDGGLPPDNPFIGHRGARPEVFSYGHRNIQGMSWGDEGRLWAVEHGPQGGDELNLLAPGANHGWPVITYGEQYGGGKIGEGTHRAGMVQPVAHWTPSFAPSGLAWLNSARYGPHWQGSLFVGALKGRALLRLRLTGTKVQEQEWLLGELKQRVRDVRVGPDGLLYLLTDADPGQLIRLQPHAP